MKIAKEAYSEILKTLKKYKDICIFDIDNLERQSKYHLFGLELKEKYGLNIDPIKIESLQWIRFNDYKIISLCGEKYRKVISWSDDGTQPEDELLFQICFSTGAYIFGEDYPTDLFQKFWLELKTFNPDYTDTANHCLYWKIENAKNIFNSFEDIMKKYIEINKEDIKQRKIKKLEEDLKKLKNY
jgi:hypothetical protein